MKRKAIALIFLFSVLIYCNSLGGAFVWDDHAFVEVNPAIRSLANTRYFFTDPATTAVGELARDVYRPITTLSYAVDFFLWGFNSFGYHLTNVILHSFNGILVFLLLSIMFGDFFLALAAGLIFISHPVQTEVVSWISGRSSVLFMFFYLLSFIFYIKARESKKIFYLYSIIFFCMSLLSKEMAITLPLILILYDLHFGRRFDIKESIVRYLPYFAIALFFVITRMTLMGQVGQFSGWGEPYRVFLTMSKVVVDYVRILFFPVTLCAIGYDVAISKSILEPAALASITFLAVILSGIPFLYRRFRAASFSILFFFITLLPVVNIIPIKALEAERFLYLPSLGFCVLIAFIISAADKRFKNPIARNGPRIAVLIAFTLIAFYALRTSARNNDWADEITIGRRTLEARSSGAWGMATLGENYLASGNYKEAIKYLEDAVAHAPEYELAYNLLGTAYYKSGRYTDAVAAFTKALRLDQMPGVPTHDKLGISYANLKMYDEAERQFKTAITEDPYFVNAHLNLGRLYEVRGDYTAALKQYLKGVIYSSNDTYLTVVNYIRIGDLYTKMGGAPKDREYYLKAKKALGSKNEGLLKLIEKKIANLPK
ncbi:MAG: tetratricopeptide repeat protein [Candidatus Omnitrophota bacterium]